MLNSSLVNLVLKLELRNVKELLQHVFCFCWEWITWSSQAKKAVLHHPTPVLSFWLQGLAQADQSHCRITVVLLTVTNWYVSPVSVFKSHDVCRRVMLLRNPYKVLTEATSKISFSKACCHHAARCQACTAQNYGQEQFCSYFTDFTTRLQQAYALLLRLQCPGCTATTVAANKSHICVHCSISCNG